MIQVIPQTRDEKIAMYMKLTRRELAEMLVASNEAVHALSQNHPWQITIPAEPATPPYPTIRWAPNSYGGETYQ